MCELYSTLRAFRVDVSAITKLYFMENIPVPATMRSIDHHSIVIQGHIRGGYPL